MMASQREDKRGGGDGGDAEILLTLVTVNWNNSDGLVKTVRSVMPVLQPQVEYIIVDGASTDGSVAAASALIVGLARVVLRSEPDQGVYDAMNKGLAMAKGRFVAYINSGDELDPEVYAKYLRFIAATKADVTYARTHLRGVDGQYLRVHERHPEHLVKETLPHLTTAFRRDALVRLGGFDQRYRICADRDLFVRARKQGLTFAYFDGVVSTFELGGLSSSPRTKIEDLKINRAHGIITDWVYWRRVLSIYWKKFRDGVRGSRFA